MDKDITASDVSESKVNPLVRIALLFVFLSLYIFTDTIIWMYLLIATLFTGEIIVNRHSKKTMTKITIEALMATILILLWQLFSPFH